MKLTHGSLFSGIGGFDLAAEWAGWESKFHCEWNEFGQKVLKYYWPKAISYGDITKTDFSIWRGRIDVLTGGFPCQPYSLAGKRLGKEDERHLWPEMLRAIREIQPSWVVGENVGGIISWNGGLVFNEVQTDLEAQGYEVLPFLLPACAVNAPHRRERVWFVAYRNSDGLDGSDCPYEEHSGQRGEYALCNFESLRASRATPDPNGTRMERLEQYCGNIEEDRQRRKDIKEDGNKKDSSRWRAFPTQPPVCGGDDGLPTGLDGITFPKWRNESIKAYGNAIVPEVAYQIFKAINEYNQLNNL